MHIHFTIPLAPLEEQRLEHSVNTLTGENKKQHDDVMAALKDIRVYRKTLNEDQLKE